MGWVVGGGGEAGVLCGAVDVGEAAGAHAAEAWQRGLWGEGGGASIPFQQVSSPSSLVVLALT